MPSGVHRQENKKQETHSSRPEPDHDVLPPGYVRASDLLDHRPPSGLAPLKQSNPFAHLEQGNPAYRALPGRDGRSYSDPLERPNIDREMTRIMVRERQRAEEQARRVAEERERRLATSRESQRDPPRHHSGQHGGLPRMVSNVVDPETARRWHEQYQTYRKNVRQPDPRQPDSQEQTLNPPTSPSPRFASAHPTRIQPENRDQHSTPPRFYRTQTTTQDLVRAVRRDQWQ